MATLVRDRTAQLRALLGGLARQTRPPDAVAVAVMGGADPQPAAAGLDLPLRWLDASSPSSRLPLSTARNTARKALADVDVLVLLDVDVIPAVSLVEEYLERVRTRPAVWSGQVDYLPALPDPGALDDAALAIAATPHPARRPPPADEPLPRPELFWSLSFALPSAVYDDVGGFDPAFVGYGGEDTDFALRLVEAGHPLCRTPAARGWHQHHASTAPPTAHLADVCANARTFRHRWGRWPMEGWLRGFAELGLVVWEPEGALLRLTPAGIRLVSGAPASGTTFAEGVRLLRG